MNKKLDEIDDMIAAATIILERLSLRVDSLKKELVNTQRKLDRLEGLEEDEDRAITSAWLNDNR